MVGSLVAKTLIHLRLSSSIVFMIASAARGDQRRLEGSAWGLPGAKLAFVSLMRPWSGRLAALDIGASEWLF